jgi:hypothetical protein
MFLDRMLAAILAAATAGRNRPRRIAAPNKKAPEGAFPKM